MDYLVKGPHNSNNANYFSVQGQGGFWTSYLLPVVFFTGPFHRPLRLCVHDTSQWPFKHSYFLLHPHDSLEPQELLFSGMLQPREAVDPLALHRRDPDLLSCICAAGVAVCAWHLLQSLEINAHTFAKS